MGLMSDRLGIRALSMEDPAQPLLPASALFESLGLGRSDAGVLINEKQALRLPTAYSCIKGISEDLASTSFEVIQELPDESMRAAKSHRLWSILHDEWNQNMSSMVARVAIIASCLGWGNGYAWIKRDGAARVVGLYPLHSGKTSPIKVNGKLLYATTQTPSGEAAQIDPANMLHIMGLSEDGIIGLSPIQLAKNAFGLAIAAEKFGAQFFGNGARSTGVLSHPGQLEDEAYEHLKKSAHEWATGESALRPIILEEGMKWEQISIPNNDAQFLETRKFQREEIAGMFRFPMHLLGSLERATNNNIEHQGLDYVRYCLRPLAIKLEHEVNRKLLSGDFTAEHNFNDLQRGDFASQTAGFQILRNIGVYSANKILRQLRQNPISEEEGGNVLTVQGAMINLTALLPGAKDATGATQENTDPDADTVETGTGEEGDPAAKRRMVIAYRALFRDAVGRVVNRDSRPADFVRNAFRPLITSMVEALLAIGFGFTTLMDTDQALIESLIPSGYEAWRIEEKNAIAEQLARTTYDRLAKEILR